MCLFTTVSRVKSIVLHMDLQVQNVLPFITFAGARLSRSRKASLFCPQSPPPGGRGEGGAFPAPNAARVAQRPPRGRPEDAQRSSEDAPRPLRDRSEDGQKRSEDARRRLEDSAYSVHKAEQGEEGAQRDLALLREEGLSEVSQLHLHLHPHHSHTLVVCWVASRLLRKT